MDDDTVAQFMAVTSCEPQTAQQYLEATDGNLESAVELFFASGGASGESQQPAAASAALPAVDDGVRERIEGFDDQLVDEEAQFYNEAMRKTRRAEARARKPRGVFNQDRDQDISAQPLSRHEKRLAELFRPPFEIITDLPLDQAKEEAQETGKLILVNVQDPAEFACQRLNRDLWRNREVRDLVDNNFVFLQYDADDPDGEDYRVLYPFESFPHIAILDPWTGEQQKVWAEVPAEAVFMEDVLDFLTSMDRPVLDAPADAPADAPSAAPAAAAQAAASAPPQTASVEPTPEPKDPIAAIEPLIREEPPQGPNTTRIQFKFSTGQRAVKRFLLEDTVAVVYGVAKEISGISGAIKLTSERRELKHELDKSVEAADLKNSTILVEQE